MAQSVLSSFSPSLWMGLVSGLISLAVLVIFVGVYKERRFREIRVRLATMNQGYQVDSPDIEHPENFVERVLRPLGRDMLARMGRMTPSGNLVVLRQQLRMAGNPANMAVIDFLGIKMLVAVGTAVLVAIYLISLRGMEVNKAILFAAVGAIVGLYLPNFWLSGRIRQRQAEISKALPNALDMLTTMVDAGLGFDIALLRLCERWNNALTQELERVVHEMRMGVRRMDALRNLGDRVDVPELRTFIAVLIQADQLGISIGNILHAQSEQIRQRRRQKIEEKAATMPLKMMPIIALFIFPALFAVLLGPSIPGVLRAFGG